MTLKDLKEFYIKKRTGGDFINEGSYGCAFTPPLGLNCRTSRKIPKHTPLISKLFNSEKHYKEELTLQKSVVAIDPRNIFTVPYYGSCFVNVDTLNAQDKQHLDKCELFNEYKYDKPSNKRVPQLIYKYGGVDLTEAYKIGAINTVDLIPLFKPLFEGVKLLQSYKSGYAHSDIKPHNIVYDKDTNKAAIIDFGLMGLISSLKDEYDILSFDYQYYPPEFKVKSNIDFGTKDARLIANYISLNFNKVSLPSIYKYWGKFIEGTSYRTLLHNFILTSLKDYSKFTTDFNKDFVYKLDTYSLAMSFLEFYHRSKVRDTKNPKLNKFLKTIVFPAINPDPRLRIGVDEIIKRYATI